MICLAICYEEAIEMGLSESKDWRSAVRDMLEILAKKYGLPKGSLYLSDNYGQMERTKDF